MTDRTPKPVWLCPTRGCGYWLVRHPRRLTNGPPCKYCGHEPYSHRETVHMIPSFRVAPDPKEIQE